MSLGSLFFKYRSFIPVPFFIFLLVFSNSNITSIIVGILISISGILMRMVIQGYTGDWMRGNQVGGEYLLTEGPYSIVRHPFYLANFFIALGIVIISNFYLFITIPLFTFVFFIYYFIIVYEEEKYLLDKFKQEYVEYKKKVPAIIPKKIYFKARRKRDIKTTLKIESSTIVTIISVILMFIGRYLWKH